MDKALKQELFDKAVAGLAGQRWKKARRTRTTSYGKILLCAYRGANNCRCGVGHLIPDDRYTILLEGLSANQESILQAVFGRASTQGEQHDHRSFLMELQQCHDSASNELDMQERLREFATDKGLVLPSELEAK